MVVKFPFTEKSPSYKLSYCAGLITDVSPTVTVPVYITDHVKKRSNLLKSIEDAVSSSLDIKYSARIASGH